MEIILGIEEWTTLLTKSSTLDPLYRKAIKAVPKEIFELHFSWLLETFAEDLNGSVRSKSQEILTRFVRRYARRTAWLVTRHIYAGDLDDLPLSRVNIEVPPSLDQFFAQLEAQDQKILGLHSSTKDGRTPVPSSHAEKALPFYETMAPHVTSQARAQHDRRRDRVTNGLRGP